MGIDFAQKYLGKKCRIEFKDSYGRDITLDLRIWDIRCAPLYGNFLMGDTYNVNLDMITSILLR